MKINRYIIVLLFITGCTTVRTSKLSLDTIPHERDKHHNLWFNLASIRQEPIAIMPIIKNYLAQKYKLEGSFIKVPYYLSKHINYLQSQGFEPYRLNTEETVWVYRNGRGIPDQANTLVDARVAIFNYAHELLLVKNRGTSVWTLPGGGVEAHEFIKEGALREVQEEVGLLLQESKLKLVALANLKFGISGQLTNIVQHFYVYTLPISQSITLEPEEIEDSIWVAHENLKPNYRFKNLPISKKIIDLARQFSSKTAQSSSQFFSNDGLYLETFKY